MDTMKEYTEAKLALFSKAINSLGRKEFTTSEFKLAVREIATSEGVALPTTPEKCPKVHCGRNRIEGGINCLDYDRPKKFLLSLVKKNILSRTKNTFRKI